MASPNYRKAESLAYKILSTFPHPAIPIDVVRIASYFAKLRIKSYSWFAALNVITIDDVVDFAQSESGCCYYNVEQNNYLILYNDTIPSAGHIRWTLGHEFGHFLLKHNELADEAVVSRNSLTRSQYETYEKEANCFARSLLAPPNLIALLNISYYLELAETFDLSPSAAKNILAFVFGSSTMGISYLKDCELTDNFKDVAQRFLQKKHCLTCGHEYSKAFTYCPICGNCGYNNAGAGYMIYPGVTLNEQGQARECLVCKNEDHLQEAKYCMICGKPIINPCSYSTMDSDYVDRYAEQCQHREPLPGNARFCPYCGSETTFFIGKMLQPYDQVPQEPLIFDDDSGELPFM